MDVRKEILPFEIFLILCLDFFVVVVSLLMILVVISQNLSDDLVAEFNEKTFS